MDQRTTYELTISEKLGQLPLPDLQDQIWARIETQLDTDMPTDDGGGAGPQSPDWRNLLGRIGPFALVVAIVTIFLLTRSSSKQEPAQSRQFPSTPVSQPVITSPGQPPGNTSNVPANGPATNPFTTNPAPLSPGDTSSSVTTILPGLPLQDTGTATTPPVLVQAPPVLKDTTVPQKKPRGVKGINDADYKIVPKKDQ
jgi:hypothetical protein